MLLAALKNITSSTIDPIKIDQQEVVEGRSESGDLIRSRNCILLTTVIGDHIVDRSVVVTAGLPLHLGCVTIYLCVVQNRKQ